jgi:hypothetical protein
MRIPRRRSARKAVHFRLKNRRGLRRSTLMALDPRSVERLDAEAVPLPDGVLERVGWQVEITKSPLIEQTHL